MRVIQVGKVQIGKKNPLALIAGPCVIESEKGALSAAEKIKRIAEDLHIGFIYKSSYKKDNRSSPTSYSGPGLKEGLRILKRVEEEFDIPVLSDVHCQEEVQPASEVLDVIQIPAYLSQQTGLTLAVGRTGKVVNVKKGQFIAPENMKNVIGKLEHTGNQKILLTERGTCFGYSNLVVDMRSFPILRGLGYPVIFDVTHTVRIYGRPSNDPTGGTPQFIPYLARAGVGAGCDGIFIETHPNPKEALCDGYSMLPLSHLKELLQQLQEIDQIVKKNSNYI
ncbi:3-deoxy-8-phosphooctulonate synthase [candidate division TA06 bacterium]|nr:3-deoxy-8-phosphooctulonate synthase [candidate division TA06 bacterium]